MPATGGTLSIAFASDIPSLDPAIGYDVYSWPAERLMFETLITYDGGTTLVPHLATEMPTISEDGTTYSFTLRDGVSFVGRDGEMIREVTASDVVYSLNRVLDPDLTPTPSPVASTFFAAIVGADEVLEGDATEATGLRAVDERTVEIEIGEQDQSFLNVLAMPFASVVPEELAKEDTAAFSADPIGTGPYVFESYVTGQQAVFIRNEHYWGEQPPADRIEIRMGIDPESQVQQVQTGTLDIMGDGIPTGSFTATVNDPRYASYVQRLTEVATNFLSMNTQLGEESPLSNVLVRRALAHAIDKSNIVTIQNGRGEVANCIFPPDMPGYDPECDPYPYDPERARELLTEAEYPEGFATTLYTFEDDPGPQVAQAIQQDLAQVGVEVEVVVQDFDTLLGTISTPGAAPLVWLGWVQDFPDPSDFIDPILSCASAVEGGSNQAFYCNEEVDALAAEARGEQDQASRLDMYSEIQRRIMDDAPWVPTDHPGHVTLVHPRVQGFSLHPVWRYDLTAYGVSE